jgi:hypothetical protein
MTFDDVSGNGKLWAVRYEGAIDNELYYLFDKWNDVLWLRNFFNNNKNDLETYFNVDINTAISDTTEDSERLEEILMDISEETDLDTIFRPLNNYTKEAYLEKEKARILRQRHTSWLRIYAIKLSQGVFIITGGTIKLTATMQERQHTAKELVKIEKVRRFLIENGIVDDTGFMDYYINECL